jgi:hypothetical protein
MPLLPATILTGIATYGILMLQRYGVRPIEAVITAMVGVIAASYVVETILARPAWGQVAYHSFVPYVSSGSVLISVESLAPPSCRTSCTCTRPDAGSDRAAQQAGQAHLPLHHS